MSWLTAVIRHDIKLEQLLRLKLPIDKGEAISNPFVTFAQEWVIAAWSGPCALTPQLPILVDKVLLVMTENSLGRNLLCMACSQCYGQISIQTCIMVHHLGPSLAYSVS